MLHIMIARGAASPIVFEHQAARAFRYWTWTLFRLALGFVVATLVYFGVLFVCVHAYSLNQPLGAAFYGVGFVLATVLAVVAGRLVSPERLSRIIVPGICGLAVMFPIGLNIYFGLMQNWQPVYLLYPPGGVWGGYVVIWTAPRINTAADQYRLGSLP